MPRNGTKNLKPVQSKEEAKKRGRAGGIKSGQVRRERKTLRDQLLAILSSGKIQDQIILSLVNEAIHGNNAGSVTKAFETIRDTIGEKPVDKVEQTNISNITIDFGDLDDGN